MVGSSIWKVTFAKDGTLYGADRNYEPLYDPLSR